MKQLTISYLLIFFSIFLVILITIIKINTDRDKLILNNKITKILSNGVGYIHELKIINGFLYAVTKTSPAKLIKINKQNLSVESIIVFPQDGKHDYATDFVYVKNKQKIYVVFGNKNTSVSEVKLKDLSYKDIFYFETKKNNAPSITTDQRYLYVISTTKPSIIHKIDLKNTKIAQTRYLTDDLSYGHTIRYQKDYLYATGENKNGWIAKINSNDLTYISQVFMKGDKYPTDDLAITDNAIYVGLEDGKGQILKIDSNNLSIKRINTKIKASSLGVYYDSRFIWSLFKTKPGTIVRINPQNSLIKRYILDKGEDYPNEIISDGKSLYITYWSMPGKISRIE